MQNPLPDKIITRVIELIESKSLPKKERDESLKVVAHEAWMTLFPDPAASGNARMHRWNEVMEQLSDNPHRDKILRVIESSASGERFHWLD